MTAESDRVTGLREVDEAWDIDVERELGRFDTRRSSSPNPPTRSRLAAAVLSIAIAALLVSGLIWVRRGAGVPEAATSPSPTATSSPEITHHVPDRAVRWAAIFANSRVCNVGSIDQPTREAATTFADALRLLPASSLPSYVGTYPPNTPVYDITYEGTCRSGGHTLHLIEVLVIVPSGELPVQIASIARYEAGPPPVQEPFGNRWEACHHDWGCGESPSPSATSSGS